MELLTKIRKGIGLGEQEPLYAASVEIIQRYGDMTVNHHYRIDHYIEREGPKDKEYLLLYLSQQDLPRIEITDEKVTFRFDGEEHLAMTTGQILIGKIRQWQLCNSAGIPAWKMKIPC